MIEIEYNSREKIEELAKSPNILEEIVRMYRPKIKGEENNIKFLFCACISKNLPRDYRLHVIITSQSSGGKSNLVNTILEPFKEDVLDFTEYTSAFLNRSESNMDGFIFKMEQMEKTNDKKQVSLASMKFLLSEGKLRIGLVDKNEKGQNTPKTLEVNGIPVFISTSTNYNIDPETLNRTFLMQVDESEEQTKRIITHVLDKYCSINYNSEWENNLQKLYEISQTYKEISKQFKGIYIPFADKIRELIPSVNLTMRRDLPKILNLTCIIAFLNFTKRKKIPFDGGQYFYDNLKAHKMFSYYLIAQPEDFKQALEIGGETIQQTLNKINSSSMDIYKTFMKLYNENPLDGVTTSDLKTITNLSQNRVGESSNSSEELQVMKNIIIEKYRLLDNDKLRPEEKDTIQKELDILKSLERKIIGEPEEEIEYDRDFNAYTFARSASILSLESSWSEIRLKMDLLVEKIATTKLEYDKFSALKEIIKTFEEDYIKLIINSKKPKTKNENDIFESKIFHRIIIDSRQLFADFHDVFIGNVTFVPKNLYVSSTQKFRAYMLDLRSKKNKISNEGKNSVCDLENGLRLSKINEQKGSLYQGYWLVDYMLTELRNHEEHWKKGDDTRKYLKNELHRNTLSDPITESESPGNFFILISILFLISYFFIEIMQTWVDTDEFLK